VRTLSIETTTHGRVLVQDATAGPAAGLIVAFHGYGRAADDELHEIGKIAGIERWTVASAQALHRFYTRGDQKVIASWMTRQDRDVAIADNVAYVDRVVDALGPTRPIIFAGFSQGAAMAYRAAMLGTHRAAGIMALGGDIPPELKTDSVSRAWPLVFVGAGRDDYYYTPAKVDADAAFLAAHNAPHDVVRFAGGHEWTNEFREVAARWLQRVIQAAATSSA
jgi:predicted esterase